MEVRFESIGKAYGATHAVRDLTLTIPNGALQFLLGPSGCGKTTTLRMLAGLEHATSGRILFDGKDVTTTPSAERGIGMVFQNYALWPHMSVRQNIEYGLKLRKLGASEIRQRVDEVLGFTQLTTYATRFPGQLSGGQQQRVALARALAIRPTVLLLDEPLSNLDAKLRHEMRDNISRIHKETGITTVYVTHDQQEALSMGTHVSVMRAGRLVQSDTPRRLYHRPHTPFIAGFIGETNLVDGVVEGDAPGVEGGLRVKTGFGVIIAAHRAPGVAAAKGTEVTLSMRPEALCPVWADDRASTPQQSTVTHNEIAAALERHTYLGGAEQLAVKTSDGQRLKASLVNPPEREHKDGAALTLEVAAADVLALPREADLSSGT